MDKKTAIVEADKLDQLFPHIEKLCELHTEFAGNLHILVDGWRADSQVAPLFKQVCPQLLPDTAWIHFASLEDTGFSRSTFLFGPILNVALCWRFP